MQLSAKGADAEVTKDSIVEALGYEPDGGTWEKICDITLTEETQNIVIDKDNDGNAFSLKKLYAVFDFQSTASYSGSGTNFYIASKNYKWVSIISSQRQYRMALAYIELVTAGKCIGWSCVSTTYPIYSATMNTSGVNDCDSTLTSFATYLGMKFPAGMTLTLYGIRAT